MRETFKELREFDAVSDDGKRVTIFERQRVTLARGVNGTLHSFDGPIFLELEDGSHVNRVEDKTYKVFFTGQILRDIS